MTPPTLVARGPCRFVYGALLGCVVLERWRDYAEDLMPVTCHQSPALAAALATIGEETSDGYQLDYPAVQSLATRFPGLIFYPPSKEQEGGGSGEGEKKKADVGGDTPDGSTNQGPGQGDKVSNRSKGQPRKKNRGRGRKNSRRRRVAGSRGGGRGLAQVIAHWPAPDVGIIERGRDIFERLVLAAADVGREAIPVRWNYRELATRSRTVQLERARVWERQGPPMMMLALDTSGSMSSFVGDLLMLGASLSEALPGLLVVGAPNGLVGALAWQREGKEFFAFRDGALWWPQGWRESALGMGTHGVEWPDICEQAGVTGVIYAGDYEEENILPLLQDSVPLLAEISIWESSWRPPTLVGGFADRRMDWPTVIGVGSVEEALTALEMVLGEWS